jgi:hypothetical protein
MCGLLYIGTPLSGDFHYRDFVIFDLDFFELFMIINLIKEKKWV